MQGLLCFLLKVFSVGDNFDSRLRQFHIVTPSYEKHFWPFADFRMGISKSDLVLVQVQYLKLAFVSFKSQGPHAINFVFIYRHALTYNRQLLMLDIYQYTFSQNSLISRCRQCDYYSFETSLGVYYFITFSSHF